MDREFGSRISLRPHRKSGLSAPKLPHSATGRRPGAEAAPYEKLMSMNYLELVAIVVDDYDEAIDFFKNVLGFELVEDSP